MKSTLIAFGILFLIVLLAFAIVTAFPPEAGAEDTMDTLPWIPGAEYRVSHCRKCHGYFVNNITNMSCLVFHSGGCCHYGDTPTTEEEYEKYLAEQKVKKERDRVEYIESHNCKRCM